MKSISTKVSLPDTCAVQTEFWLYIIIIHGPLEEFSSFSKKGIVKQSLG
jgi:hypothetical protein